MATIARLGVQLGMNNDDFNNKVKSSRSVIKGLGNSLASIGMNLSTKLTLPIAGIGIAAIKAGSDLNESLSAVNTVFGASAKKIAATQGSVAQALNISRQEALDAAAQFGALYKGAGFASNTMAEFANQSLSAAADLSSFYNVPVPEALAAIRSGLTGEYEPLKRFGILLNENTIKAYAVAHGLADASGNMTDQQKVAARQGYIMEHLGAAQGDAARTASGLANSLRRLKAKGKDVLALFGTLLLPMVLQLVGRIEKWVDWLAKLNKTQQKWIMIGLGVLAVLGPVLFIAGQLAIAISALIPVFSALGVVIGTLLSPIGLIVAAVILLGLAWYKNWFGLRDLTARALGFIIPYIMKFINVVKSIGSYLISVARGGKVWSKSLERLPKPLQPFIMILGRVIKIVRVFVKTFMEKGLFAALLRMETQFRALGGAISRFVTQITGSQKLGAAFLQVFVRIGTTFRYLVKTVQALINGDWRGAWDNFLKFGRQAFYLLEALAMVHVQAILYLFQTIPWGTIAKYFWMGMKLAGGYLWKGLQWAWKEVPPRLMIAIVALVTLLYQNRQRFYNFGRTLIGWIWVGIKSLLAWIGIMIHELPNILLGALHLFGPFFYNAGRDIVSALWIGISSLGGWLWQMVWDFAKRNTIGALNHAIGRNSPPKAFIEAGSDSVAAYASGAWSQLRRVSQVMSQVGQQGIGASKPQFSYAPGIPGTKPIPRSMDGRGNGANRQYNIKVDIHEQTNGKKIVRELRSAIRHVDAGEGSWQ